MKDVLFKPDLAVVVVMVPGKFILVVMVMFMAVIMGMGMGMGMAVGQPVVFMIVCMDMFVFIAVSGLPDVYAIVVAASACSAHSVRWLNGYY
jgi:hypothetical protein